MKCRKFTLFNMRPSRPEDFHCIHPLAVLKHFSANFTFKDPIIILFRLLNAACYTLLLLSC